MLGIISILITIIIPMVNMYIILSCEPISKLNLLKYKYKYMLITMLTISELIMVICDCQLLGYDPFVIHLNVLTYIGLIVASFLDYLTAKKVIRDNKNLEINKILSELNIKV